MKDALIIFVKNPVAGKVKTRLAATIGDDNAVKVYKFLLQHTRQLSENIPVEKFVFYGDEINHDDLWNGYQKKIQSGDDLGQKMESAFELLFNSGFERICIIGSDCFELTTSILLNAFRQFDQYDAVVGGAFDGGYYLLGMQQLIPTVFSKIPWSSWGVLNATLERIREQQLSVYQLPVLSDVDTADDITFNY